MTDIKTIGASSLMAIIVTISILGGASLLEDDIYYCEDRGIVMKCDSLSAYYGLPNGKCWNEEIGNKLCRSGWTEVVDDIETKKEIMISGEHTDWIICSNVECRYI